MRANPAFDAATVITELGVGEALVSFLDDKGRPAIVERAFVLPPSSRLGPLTDVERRQVIQSSIIFGHYEKTVDRESAYEKLTARATEAAHAEKVGAGGTAQTADFLGSLIGAAAKSAVRTIGSQVGRELVRGVLGSLLGGGRRR
jgi:hypothetical protein